MCRRLALFVTLITALAQPTVCYGTPSLFERVADGVWVVRDDNGCWGGAERGLGITHQVEPNYWAKKTLDLSAVPEAVWAAIREVRLSVYFCVRDYSWHDGERDGLDEEYEVLINGRAHRYPTSGGAPVMEENRGVVLDWHDFLFPPSTFRRGGNEIIIRKAASPRSDDYLYLGIDNSSHRGHSCVSFDSGATWTTERLTVPGGKGEYMVRLYLLARDTAFESRWQPGGKPALVDPHRVIAYAGAHRARVSAGGIRLAEAAREARIEWTPDRLDRARPLAAIVETDAAGPFAVSWLDAEGRPASPMSATGPRFEATLPASRALQPSGLVVAASGAPLTLRSVSVRGSLHYRPLPAPVNLRPDINPPAGHPAKRVPSCRITGGTVVLQNAGLRCQFTAAGRLRLSSLYNEHAAAEMIRQPGRVDLFLVEVAGKRYSGTRDFLCRQVRPAGRHGFTATLVLPEPALEAAFTGTMTDEGIRLGLSLTNRGTGPVDMKVAFPHLAGLALSRDPSADYYFFPWGGGIIAACAAHIRRGYGDHAAIYQVMDLFSPERGAGFSIRADDPNGRYKVLALRKSVPGEVERNGDQATTPTTPDFCWQESLPPVTGTGFTYEYLRRTRPPHASFSPAAAVLAAHPGDWRIAMRNYAAWTHRVWKFRPYPSRLHRVVTMIAVGWGQDILFRNGRYRTDFLQPRRDCIELMSWWEWSPLGPWRTPLDRLAEVLGPGTAQMWEPYIVTDPVTGQRMWNNQPGDYDGYNQRFGGLPAFRKAMEQWKASGALITLYTDPIRCDDNSKTGRQHGEEWGVFQPDGTPVKNYDVWNMCHDVAEYREWVARTMERVLRETGADGIRLDEYGHQGWACFSPHHKHTFAEPGCTEWLRAIAETAKLVRQAMDRVDPRSVLTTEHPGYDFLLPFLDGCITYDLTVQRTPLRPVECNLQRFFFPECKAYELDHMGADPTCRKRLWNGVAFFGVVPPPAIYAIFRENNDALASRTCEPLVPTLTPFLYANRFSAGNKTLWTILNATGRTFDGPALRVSLRPDQHLVDLLRCEPVAPVQGRVYLHLTRDDVTCVARLPRLLQVTRSGNTLRVALREPVPGARVALCTADAEVLESVSASRVPVTLSLSAATGNTPRCVKLLQGDCLQDMVPLPPDAAG